MSQFPKEKLELAKQEFTRTRELLMNIYHSGVEYIQNGLRGTSDKQYNLCLSLLSIAVVMIGVVTPIILQFNISINHILLCVSMCCFLFSFFAGLGICFYIPRKDRFDLNTIWKAQNTSLNIQLDLVKDILSKIDDETLTIQDVNEYNEKSILENKSFTEKTKIPVHKTLDFLYYSFIGVFIMGLLILMLAFGEFIFHGKPNQIDDNTYTTLQIDVNFTPKSK